MSRDDDDRPVPQVALHPTVGDGLDAMSVEELRARLGLLRQEIIRLEAAIEAKQASRGAADAFFKR